MIKTEQNFAALKRFSIGDKVFVSYPSGLRSTEWPVGAFFAVIEGFSLNDMDEVLLNLRPIVHYQDDSNKLRYMNPISRNHRIELL